MSMTMYSISPVHLTSPQKSNVPGRLGRPPSNIAKRVREEGKTGFPYGLVGDVVVKYNNDNVDELRGMLCNPVEHIYTCTRSQTPPTQSRVLGGCFCCLLTKPSLAVVV